VSDETELVPVTALADGDLVDLASDKYADAGHGTPGHVCPYESEYLRVGDDNGCPGRYAVFVMGGPGIYWFPVNHNVRRQRQGGEQPPDWKPWEQFIIGNGDPVEKLLAGGTKYQINAPVAFIESGVEHQVALLRRLLAAGLLLHPDTDTDAGMAW
jgi:hypothetical protein